MTIYDFFSLFMKMVGMSIVIIWLSIDLIMSKAIGRENEVVAISGCNATLEWTIGTTYLETIAYAINVINANGLKIAEKKAMKCKFEIDSSMYCEVRNTSTKEWRFVVVLFNVTQASSGKYTGQLKYGPRNETNVTTELKVIDKPQIKEETMSIIHEPLQIACTIDGELEDPIYYWKLNGTYLNSTERIWTESFHLRYERVTLVDTFTLFSCIVCSGIICCIESDTYVPDPYYGPDSVKLSLNHTDIYLRVYDTFKVMCSAKCNPTCTFLWDGYISSRNEELLINSFDSRMAGVYSCIAINLKTGVTVKSFPIVLHYVPDTCTNEPSPGHNGDLRFKQYWIGTVIVFVFLIIVGSFIFARHWRKRLASVRGEAENFRRPCSIWVPAKRNRVMKLLTTVNRESKIDNEDGQSQALHNSRNENAEPSYKKTAFSFYDYATGSVMERNAHATESSTKHGHYDYVPSIAICHVETADVHVTDENYITPINDPDCPVELCENEATDLPGRDPTYITPICDYACPIIICHDTDVLTKDETYITPIIK